MRVFIYCFIFFTMSANHLVAESKEITCTHPDYAALVALYLSTNGPEWTNNDGWLTDCDPCSWNGIFCSGNRVIELTLGNNNLIGVLPKELALMDNLRYLDVGNNQLSGCYPNQLTVLCNQLRETSKISSGNQLVETWDNFCNDLSGVCCEDNLSYTTTDTSRLHFASENYVHTEAIIGGVTGPTVNMYGENSIMIEGPFSVDNVQELTMQILDCYDFCIPPSLAWGGGSTSNDEGKDIVVGPDGSIYVIGDFFGTFIIQDTTLISEGSTDVFIAKFDADSNLIWIHSINGTKKDVGVAIDIDVDGNTYILSEINSNQITIADSILTTSSNQDILLAKFNTEGEIQWAKHEGNGNFLFGKDLVVDQINDIIITGDFAGDLDLSGIEIDVNRQTKDIYLAKYSSNGDIVWAQRQGNFSNFEFSKTLEVDLKNSILLGLEFNDSTNIGGQEYVSKIIGKPDIVVAKFNSSGTFIWAQHFETSDISSINSITPDAADNVYFSGSFRDSLFINGDTVITGQTGSQPNQAILLVKLNSSGIVNWHKAFNNNQSIGNIGSAVSVNKVGQVLLAGTYKGDMFFDHIEAKGIGNDDMFVCTLNPDGRVTCLNAFGSVLADRLNNLAIGGLDGYYVTGRYRGTMTVGNTLTSLNSSNDFYVAGFK